MGKLYGLYGAKVTNVKDPEKRGRVKVLCPDVFDDSPSNWCEPCVPFAQDFGGDFVLPELDDFVWITFAGGDIDSPIYLGGWWAENSTPLGDDYSQKNKVRLITFGGMSITFDKKTKLLTFMNEGSENTCMVDISAKKVTISGNAEVTGNAIVRGNATVEGNATVKGDAIIKGTATITGKATIKSTSRIEGNLNITGKVNEGVE